MSGADPVRPFGVGGTMQGRVSGERCRVALLEPEFADIDNPAEAAAPWVRAASSVQSWSIVALQWYSSGARSGVRATSRAGGGERQQEPGKRADPADAIRGGWGARFGLRDSFYSQIDGFTPFQARRA